jgi:hypothetical protein
MRKLGQARRSIVQWIAILAVLMNALAPSMSMALSGPSGSQVSETAQWVEVCASTGTTWVLLAADGSTLETRQSQPADAPGSLHAKHCLYCLTHAASFALPVEEPAPFVALHASPVHGFDAVSAPRTGSPWRAQVARAPPVNLL